MYALRYGTIPIVHHTGGLADTVRDWDGRDGTGLTFAPYEVQALQGALERAQALYQTSAYDKMRLNAMACDFSWEKSAAKYREIYQRLCSA
jgi:starch synthase